MQVAVLPRLPRESLGGVKRLADSLGLQAFYPLVTIVAQGLGSPALLFAAEVLQTVASLVFVAGVWGARRALRKGRAVAAAAAYLFAALTLPLLLVEGPLSEIVFLGSRLVSFVTTGLVLLEFSGSGVSSTGLRRSGGLIVLASFLLVVREPLINAVALILLALGMGGSSHELRRLYRANLSGVSVVKKDFSERR